ncbi:MAG: universal stress protein [Salinirussus sp.]
MYRILMPIDESVERGLNQAQYVAGRPHEAGSVEVVLTHVLEGLQEEVPDAMQTPDRVESVREVRDELEEQGYEVQIAEAGTPPSEGILDIAGEVGADEIVMGGRKRSPAGKVLFGSVTQSVLLETDLPVVVTGG